MNKHSCNDMYLKSFVIVVVACLFFCFLFSVVMATSTTIVSKHVVRAILGKEMRSVPAVDAGNITLTATEQKRAEDRFISALALMKASVELSTRGQEKTPPFLRFWDAVLSTPDLRALYAGKAAYMEQQGTEWKKALLDSLDSVFEYVTRQAQKSQRQGNQMDPSSLSEEAPDSSSEDNSRNVDNDDVDRTNKE
jgi:hypothetical protein